MQDNTRIIAVRATIQPLTHETPSPWNMAAKDMVRDDACAARLASIPIRIRIVTGKHSARLHLTSQTPTWAGMGEQLPGILDQKRRQCLGNPVTIPGNRGREARFSLIFG